MKDLQHIRLIQQSPNSYDIEFVVNPVLTTTSDPLMILLQMVVKLCMTTPGSNDFFPSEGAGFQKLVERMPRNQADADELRLQVHGGVKDMDRHIKSYQSRDTSIKPSGRLRNLSVDSRRDIVIIQSAGIMIVPMLVETYDGAINRIAPPFVSSGGQQ